MKTLFERLKPEYKAQLLAQFDNYPNAIKAAVVELKNENSILDLRVGTAMCLVMYLDLKSSDVNQVLNLFESK
jgi:hypothetical protein